MRPVLKASNTGHFFTGSVRQLTRGMPSLVPVPIKMISDFSAGNFSPVSTLDKPVFQTLSLTITNLAFKELASQNCYGPLGHSLSII